MPKPTPAELCEAWCRVWGERLGIRGCVPVFAVGAIEQPQGKARWIIAASMNPSQQEIVETLEILLEVAKKGQYQMELLE